MVIDGTTQPDVAPLKSTPLQNKKKVTLTGKDAFPSWGLHVTAGACSVSGLAINGAPTGIQVDGGTPLSFFDIFFGTDGDGTRTNNVSIGVYLNPGVTGMTIDNALFAVSGVGVTGSAASNIAITNTLFNTDPTGNLLAGSSTSAVNLSNSNNVTFGAPGQGNVAVNYVTAIQIGGNDFTAQGNTIGQTLAGTVGGGLKAFDVTGANFTISGNVIDNNTNLAVRGLSGPGTIDQNTIQNNGSGIYLFTVPPTIVSGNTIHIATTGFGIGVGASGNPLPPGIFITENLIDGTFEQPIDLFADGQNTLINLANLTSAKTDGATTTIDGTFHGDASKTYRIEAFQTNVCHGFGYGPGTGVQFMGFANFTTNASGDATIHVVFPFAGTVGSKATATITDSSNSTSEFSQCIDIISGSTPTPTPTPKVVPFALRVDSKMPNPGSNSDGVLEPGETVPIAPTWKNKTSVPIPLTSAASDFGGPSGPIYDIVVAAADYGTLAANSGQNCSPILGGVQCFTFSLSSPVTRPSTHWDAHFTETPSTGDPPKVWTLHIGSSFADVGPANPYYPKVETMLHNGITSGCTPTTYCPGDPVSRGQMSIFVAKTMAGGGANVPVSGTANGQPYNCIAGGTSIFTDVAPTDLFCKFAHYLAAHNVTLGCSSTQFCPAADVNRASMAGFVTKALVAPAGGPGVPLAYTDPTTGLSYSCDPSSPQVHFTDMLASNPFCKHAHYLWAKGIVSGCSATTYCPAADVTRDTMAKFVVNSFDLKLYGP
jgi:hypothetical protein